MSKTVFGGLNLTKAMYNGSTIRFGYYNGTSFRIPAVDRLAGQWVARSGTAPVGKLSGDGNHILSNGSLFGSVTVYQYGSGSWVQTGQFSGGSGDLTPDASVVAVGNANGGDVYIYELQGGSYSLQNTIGLPVSAGTLLRTAISPDGALVGVATSGWRTYFGEATAPTLSEHEAVADNNYEGSVAFTKGPQTSGNPAAWRKVSSTGLRTKIETTNLSIPSETPLLGRYGNWALSAASNLLAIACGDYTAGVVRLISSNGYAEGATNFNIVPAGSLSGPSNDFGYTVSLSADAETLVVGSRLSPAKVYRYIATSAQGLGNHAFENGSWQQAGGDLAFQQESAVSVSDDGDTVLYGNTVYDWVPQE